MRIHVLSDLHLEFGPVAIPATDADVIVLAGDIDLGVLGIEWILDCFPNRTVLYVLGNHEFYRNDLIELRRAIAQLAAGTKVHVLENSMVDIGGYSFLGCTLWTDFSLRGNAEHAMINAERLMNDFRLITNGEDRQRLRARDLANLHQQSVAWLRSELRKRDPEKTIVITHHAPSSRCEASEHVGGPLSPAFVANLDALIKPSGVPLWIHGHTHHNVDFILGRTRIISNQRGYPSQECPGFAARLVVDL